MRTTSSLSPLLGESAGIQELRDFIVGVSLLSGPILITGATGTGKSLAARKIHAVGRTAAAPFVKVACQRFQEDELQSLLFGDGSNGFRGVLTSAEEGTCCLSAIEHLPRSIARRLVTILLAQASQKASRPRLIFTSCFSLEDLRQGALIDSGLLELISNYHIWIPPLQERREDIPVLSRYQLWLRCGDDEYETRWNDFESEMLPELMHYPWPGNVTELIGIVHGYCDHGPWSDRVTVAEEVSSESERAHIYLRDVLDGLHQDFLTLLQIEDLTGRSDLVLPIGADRTIGALDDN